MTWPKNWRIWSNISGCTGPTSAIFSLYESALGADGVMDLFFRFVKGRCHGSQIMLGESNERRLILPAFFALAFENELEYHYLYVRINSNVDQGTSAINLVSCWPVPPEFTRINCVQQASYSTRVCLFTFARWQHSYVSLLFARGRYCSAERAIYARLCHAFLVAHETKGVDLTGLLGEHKKLGVWGTEVPQRGPGTEPR